MKANGLTFSNANAESFALGYCDVFNVLVQALANVPSLTARGLAQGAERIGRSLPSALMLGLNVAAGHHDGAGAFYADAYQDSCSCFGYKGPLQLI
jgi:NO-binding membrane sensor protein with MHYT domain